MGQEKPTFLYHGSITPDIESLEPRKRYTPGGQDVPERIYAGDWPAFAAAHSFPWSSEEGFDLSIEDGKLIFRVPVEFKNRLMQKVYLYKVSSDQFEWTTGEGTGHTYHSETAIKPEAVQEFNTVQEAVEHFGGRVVYIENHKEQMSDISLRQIYLDDWEKYKTIRLEALQNDPQAFGGSYEKELQRTDTEWQELVQKVSGENAKGIIVVAQGQNREFVGTIGAFEKEAGIWRVNAVYVKPSHRGKGISKKLLDQIMGIIETAKNAKELELTVNIDQEAAVQLYKKAGFEILDIEKDHIMGDGKAYDSYRMKKELIKVP